MWPAVFLSCQLPYHELEKLNGIEEVKQYLHKKLLDVPLWRSVCVRVYVCVRVCHVTAVVWIQVLGLNRGQQFVRPLNGRDQQRPHINVVFSQITAATVICNYLLIICLIDQLVDKTSLSVSKQNIELRSFHEHFYKPNERIQIMCSCSCTHKCVGQLRLPSGCAAF